MNLHLALKSAQIRMHLGIDTLNSVITCRDGEDHLLEAEVRHYNNPQAAHNHLDIGHLDKFKDLAH